MDQRSTWRCKLATVLVASVLVTPALTACGGDGEDGPNGSDVPDRQPVRIGMLADWGGEQGAVGTMLDEVIALVREELAEQGGILNGRPVEIITADSESTVGAATVGFRSLVMDSQVSAIAGGSSGTAALAGAPIPLAEEYGVPYFFFEARPADLTGYPYVVRVNTLLHTAMAQSGADFLINGLTVKKVALLADGGTESHPVMSELTSALADAGVEVVFEAYPEVGTTNFTSSIDRARDEKVDVLVTRLTSPTANLSLLRQVYQKGGWNDIKHLSLSPTSMFAIHLPAAEGTYHLAQWYPDLPFRANQAFADAFEDKYDGREPNLAHFYGYVGLWTVIHSIELAGSDDPNAIAQAARSGELTWDSPAGPYRIGTDGEHNLPGRIVMIEDGRMVAMENREQVRGDGD